MRAVSRNTKRKIRVDGRLFVWWLYEEWEEPGPVTLAIASADKRFLLRYQINQPDDDSRYVTVMGRDFMGLSQPWSGWIRVHCPVLPRRDDVRPADVRKLLDWCLRPKAEVIRLDWEGRQLRP
jgi:hypothetical protein